MDSQRVVRLVSAIRVEGWGVEVSGNHGLPCLLWVVVDWDWESCKNAKIPPLLGCTSSQTVALVVVKVRLCFR